MLAPVAEFVLRIQNGARRGVRSLPVAATHDNLSMAMVLLNQGFLSNVARGTNQVPHSPTAWIHAPSHGDRRFWIDLKYRADDRAVLEYFQLVSKPGRKLIFERDELMKLTTGRRARYMPPLRLGEIGIINTGPRGFMEIKDAVRVGCGGELVAKAM